MANRESLWEYLENRQNRPGDIGYDYRGRILQRTVSSLFYAEPKRASILLKMEDVWSALVDMVKTIKKAANYNIPKNFRDFN